MHSLLQGGGKLGSYSLELFVCSSNLKLLGDDQGVPSSSALSREGFLWNNKNFREVEKDPVDVWSLIRFDIFLRASVTFFFFWVITRQVLFLLILD